MHLCPHVHTQTQPYINGKKTPNIGLQKHWVTLIEISLQKTSKLPWKP